MFIWAKNVREHWIEHVFQSKEFLYLSSNLHASWLSAFNLAHNKNKLCKTSDYWSRDIVKFYFSGKGLWIVSPPHIVSDFLRKMFLVLYSINWPYFILWLPLLLDIFVNMCIAIVWFPGCDVINYETYLIFLIKSFFYMTQISGQKFKYPENEKSF